VRRLEHLPLPVKLLAPAAGFLGAVPPDELDVDLVRVDAVLVRGAQRGGGGGGGGLGHLPCCFRDGADRDPELFDLTDLFCLFCFFEGGKRKEEVVVVERERESGATAVFFPLSSFVLSLSLSLSLLLTDIFGPWPSSQRTWTSSPAVDVFFWDSSVSR